MEKFVVAYKIDGVDVLSVKTGTELAHLVGFSDCYPLDYVHVWKLNKRKMEMIPCHINTAMEPPLNRLYIEVLAGWKEEYWYEWPEH